MKVAALLGVKDEVELIEACIVQLETIGVDHILVYDDHSTDGTERVLQRLLAQGRIALHQVNVDDITGPEDLEIHLQLMRSTGADWVVSLDADELLLPRSGRIHECRELQVGGGDIVTIERFNVPLGEHGPWMPASLQAEHYEQLLMVSQPVRHFWADPQLQERVPWIQSAVNPKVIARLDCIGAVTDGMHEFLPPAGREVRRLQAQDLVIAHLPFSSLERFRRKMVNVSRMIDLHEAEFAQQGMHWVRWRRLQRAGRLEQEYHWQCSSADQIQQLIEQGRVSSARQWFSAQVASTPPAPAGTLPAIHPPESGPTMSTPSTEIHVAISADRVSAIKGQLLLRSLVHNGHLPGPWKLVFTAAPAAGQGYEAPWFAWRKHANVEFRPVPEDLWADLKWQGVLLQRLLYPHSADVVLFMALDTLVVGPLAALVRRAAAGHAWLMVPARKPPADVDLDALIAALKLPPTNGELHYSGYGLEFLQPKDAPPYFNTALAAAPSAVANTIAASLMSDWQAVAGQTKSGHGWRLALMANLMRNKVPVAGLDQRYSLNNADHGDEPLVQGPEAEVAASHFQDALQHPRVLHYLVHNEEFQPQRDLDGVMALRAFCERDDGDAGVRRVRDALRALVAIPTHA